MISAAAVSGCRSRTLVLGLVLLLAACAHSGGGVIDSPQEIRQSAFAAWVGAQPPGSRTAIDAPELGGSVTVEIEREYFSAAGLHCKRVLVFNGSPLGEPVAVCDKDAGEWVLVPRIWGGSPAKDSR
ncbi:MAG: DVU3141 family protein [Desulfobacterales bacterium]